MTAGALPEWLSAELAQIHGNSHERLEEFAFHVSQDMDWINSFTKGLLQESTAVNVHANSMAIIEQSRSPLQQLELNVGASLQQMACSEE